MKNIIIGTAGHVDHGKTRLIKALSGIDTDRLEEEKKRGITIELGFAHIPNDDGYNIGVIDVPGHEKFIKNMLAGIGGIDFVLFVVAADEGIMPQTREHFEILQALGIDDGIIAITKIDMVDAEWLDLLLEEVQDYFRGSFLESKPIIPVSSASGENLDVLKDAIIAKCDRDNKRREEKELFRLPIDRVFTMQGYGTVVTGTLMDGQVSTGDEVYIYPKGTKARVRGIQTYGKDTDTAYAGQRTAVNLSGTDKYELRRGDVLAFKGAAVASSMLDVRLKIFESADKTVLNNSRVHLYIGASEVLCKVILLDRDALTSGEESYVQLRTEEPIAVRRGDRFIIRFYSPMISIGGGVVLDAVPTKHKRNKTDVLEGIRVMDEGSISEIILTKAGENRFIRYEKMAEELGLLKSEMDEAIDEMLQCGDIVMLPDATLLSKSRYDYMKSDLSALINDYHKLKPLSDGMSRQELLSRLRIIWHTEDDKLIQGFVERLTDEGIIENRGKSVSLSGFNVEYSEEQLDIKRKIRNMYIEAGLEMIKTEDVIQAAQDGNLARAIIDDLADEGDIIKLNSSYYIHSEAWNEAIRAVRSFPGNFTLAEFRDKLGTSRKYASELLTSMDKMGITRFNNDAREVIER